MSIEGSRRETCKMLALAEEPARFESGGMLLMRRREEAEGESRIMGSGRRPDFLSLEARDAVAVVVGAMADGFLRSLKNCSECLRIWEKSFVKGTQYLLGAEIKAQETYRGFNAAQNAVPVPHPSF